MLYEVITAIEEAAVAGHIVVGRVATHVPGGSAYDDGQLALEIVFRGISRIDEIGPVTDERARIASEYDGIIGSLAVV